ncbi:MAG: response regulator, partial [Desulfovibrionaceae bacterium]|nr:response regulator [Desulfovibrionaceae bacterium]
IMQFGISEKSIAYTMEVDDAIPTALHGDEYRLAQVITNLLSNAVKFTPEGGKIALRAELLGEKDSMCEILVSVRDTGIGISEEAREGLFQAFQQAETGTTRKYGGTGLGLSICKHFVELMGGRIWLESTPGEGTTFFFTVKMIRSTDTLPVLPHGKDWHNVRVMVVDDQQEVCQEFLHFADDLRFEMHCCQRGQDALEESAQDGPYDIYFVDWQMPEMDGIELSKRLLEKYAGSSIIIMTSAAQWSDIAAEAHSLGVFRFLPKPLSQATVANLIEECFAREEGTQGQMNVSYAGRIMLLAEDNEINREIVISLLEDTGIAIECAENGKQAVEMFSAAPENYDIILMDIHMPEMDGLEAARRIRALNDRKARTVPIIALTANVFKEDTERSLAAGMNDHLGKPIDLDALVQKMNLYLRRH